MRRWRDQRAREGENAKWARLELDLGRFAQGAGISGGFLLGLAAIAATILQPDLPIVSNFRRMEMALWLPTLTASFFIAGFTMVNKMDAFRGGYRSAHFASAAGAFAVSILVLILGLFDNFSLISLEGSLRNWMYPLAVLGMSLAFVSLAMTWEGMGWRKTGSILTALAVPLSLIPLGFLPPLTEFAALSLVYMLDAFLIVVSGSLLHLIASTAEAAERTILKASDAKITSMKQEMTAKLESLAYREKAYVEREAHLEARERDLNGVERELHARTADLNQSETKLDAQSRTLKDIESRLAKMRAELEAKVEEIGIREKDLKATRTELEQANRTVAEREKDVSEREKLLKRGEIEASSRDRSLEAKSSQLTEMEDQLTREAKDLETRRAEVLRDEKALELKESEVQLKIEQLEAQQSTEIRDKIGELKDWESKVLAKERSVGEREVQATTALQDAARRATQLEAREGALAKQRSELEDREVNLVAREKELADLQSGVRERASEFERRWKELRELESRLGTREAEYTTRFKDAKLREADVESAREEFSRREAALNARETKLTQWQSDLKEETKKLDANYRSFLSEKKGLEGKAAELSLRELEYTTKDRELAKAEAAGIQDIDQAKALEMAQSRLREREEEFKRRMYQREKELEAREVALREQLKAVVPAAEGVGSAVEAEVDESGKMKTGTPRLDDLMYGGVPLNSNVLFIGPSFVGKEVAILNFVAEGLRTNAPTILVTTSKPPVEIAKDMAPVLPTFMEYERLGLVRWVDASNSTPTQKLTRDGFTYRIPNATDFEGILTALAESDREFREKGHAHFRLAYLTLSSSISQAEEKSAFAFVQRVVNTLRQTKCVAAFALERGMHTDREVESLEQLMDGAVMFRQEKSKTFLSVIGIGEAQTRDWVPYKFTNKSLLIGSFQLERIR